MPITLDGTNGITTPTYNGADTSEYLVPVTQFKNRIINGAMVIDQRNAGASVTVNNSNVYPVDRTGCYNNTAAIAFTAQQRSTANIAHPAGFNNSILITVTTSGTPAAGTEHKIYNYIEGFNASDLKFGTSDAQTFTVSFWVRSSVTGTFAIGFFNAGGTRAYSTTYTINSANTWEQKSITIAGDTSGTWDTTNGIGLGVNWYLGSGSNFQISTGSWTTKSGSYGSANSVFGAANSSGTNLVATNGATFYITGVQLEVGSTATSFDYRPYTTELQLCQRYTYRHSAEGNVDNYAPLGQGRYYGTNTAQLYVPFKVTMRTSPSTVTQVGNIVVNDTAFSAFAITLALNETSSSGATVTGTTTSGTTAGNATTFYADNTSNAALIFSAEL